MFETVAELEILRRREFRRWLVASALLHAVLGTALVLSPDFSSPPTFPGAVSVDLVSLPGPVAPQPAARPAPVTPPAPEPVAVKPPPPPPVQPPPVQERVVLPVEPTRPAEQPKPKPKPRPDPAPAAPPAQEDYQDVLARLRSEAGDAAAPPAPTEVASAAGGAAGGAGVPVGPEVAAWLRDARTHVRRNWVLPPGFRDQRLETHLQVEIDAAGRVVGEPRVTRRSGNPWYDESVARAIVKASPLPAPPQAGAWAFVFRPDEAL